MCNGRIDEPALRLAHEVGGAHAVHVAAEVRAGVAQHRHHELFHLLGALALGTGEQGLPCRSASASQHRGEDGAAGTEGQAVAPHQLAQGHPAAVGPRTQRAVLEVALDVVGQRIDGWIAVGRQLVQRMQHDAVEVATQGLAALRIGCCFTGAAGLAGEHRFFQRGTRVTR